MSHVLITNDDGISSPALAPLAHRLARLGRVEVVVPDRERSWIAKAITRHDEIEVGRVDRDGIVMHTTTGYPADCVQLGIHSLFDDPPELVVSGINIGFNHGSAYILSSGTVGAASEAWIGGVPAIALSAGTNRDWASWARWVRTADSEPMWARLADVGADIIATIRRHDFPDGADVISINLPEHADLDTPRKVVGLARVGYDQLFRATGPDKYAHHYRGGFVHFTGLEGTDIETTQLGEVAITPIQLSRSGSLSEELKAALER